jgi:hypothetical protein
LTDRVQIFVVAGIYSVVGLYLFVFGALVLSGVVDAYFEFIISFLFTTTNLPLINFAAPTILFIFAACIFILGAYYFLEDVLKHYVRIKFRKDNEIGQKEQTNEIQQYKSENSFNSTMGGVLLIIGIFQLFYVVSVFLSSTPISLFDSIRINPFGLRFPVIFVLLFGGILWILSSYFFIEAIKDFKRLEKTQIAYVSKKSEKNEIIE